MEEAVRENRQAVGTLRASNHPPRPRNHFAPLLFLHPLEMMAVVLLWLLVY